MTPCDVFPYLRGRTTWLVGDSMQQACLSVAGNISSSPYLPSSLLLALQKCDSEFAL